MFLAPRPIWGVVDSPCASLFEVTKRQLYMYVCLWASMPEQREIRLQTRCLTNLSEERINFAALNLLHGRL